MMLLLSGMPSNSIKGGVFQYWNPDNKAKRKVDFIMLLLSGMPSNSIRGGVFQ